MKKIGNKVLIVSIFIVLLAIVSIVILTNQNKKSSTVVKNFESNYGNFEVRVPKQWKCDYNSFIEPTEEMEGTPDGGIQIHIDDESFISIIVSRSRIYYNGEFQENIQTEDGVIAKAYSYNNDGRINEIEFSDSIGVIIKCDNDVYDKYQSTIMDMVKTIKIK